MRKMPRKLFAPSLLLITCYLLLVPVLAAAQDRLVPCEGGVPGTPGACEVADLFELLVRIYNYLLGLSAIVAVLMIIFGGVKMMIHYFSEQPEQDLTNAKYTITRAIFGLVIIIGAYLIVNTLTATILGAGPLTDFFSDLQ